MNVGQAHLLEDLINLVRASSMRLKQLHSNTPQIELSESDESTILERMTFTYGLGEQHGLFEQIKRAQGEID